MVGWSSRPGSSAIKIPRAPTRTQVMKLTSKWSQDFGLTATQKGFLVAVPLLGGSLFRIGIGVLSDRYGPRRIGLANMLLVSVPLAWAWLAGDSFVKMVGVGLLLGIAGASFAVSLPLASRAYPLEHQGLAMGVA